MLKIIIEDKYSLRLPTNIEIQIVEENPLLSEDNIPSAYSLSFELEPDIETLKIFGFPTRIASNVVQKKVRARIISGIINYSAGELLLISFDKKLKLQYKGSIETLGMVTPLNELNLGTIDLGLYPIYPDNMNYSNSWADQYRIYMQNQKENQQDFAVGPTRILNTEWEGTGYTFGSKNGIKTYQNFMDPRNPDGFVLDCQNTNPVDNLMRFHTPIMPYPYVKDIISTAFGTLLESNPFATGDLAKLCVISENHPKNMIDWMYQFYSQYVDSDHTYVRDVMFPLVDDYTGAAIVQGGVSYYPLKITLQKFMKQYKFNEFLKNILKIFGMSAYPGIKYQILRDDDILSRDAVINLDQYLIGDPEIDYDMTERQYVFEYSSAGENGDDVYHKINNLSIATADIFSWHTDALREYEYQNLSTNEVLSLKKTLRGLSNLPWIEEKVKRSALVQKQNDTAEETFTVTSEVSPLEMSVEQYWWDNEGPIIHPQPGVFTSDLIERRHWNVPVMEKTPINAAPKIMMSYGNCRAIEYSNHIYPLITNHNVDMFGNRLGDVSLLPNGPDGVVNKFQSYKKNWIEKKKMNIKGSFCIPEIENKKLNIQDKVYLKGRLFLIKTREYSLTHQGISPVDLELVEDL
jgi:hypothetical protein